MIRSIREAVATGAKRRKVWGWGYEGEGVVPSETDAIARTLASHLGADAIRPRAVPGLGELVLPPSRVTPPASLAAVLSGDRRHRAEHTFGQAYVDLVRGLRGEYRPAPDLVAFPRDEADIAAILEWCGGERIAAIPYGGGSSVVGGIEAAVGEDHRGAVSIDLRLIAGLVEVDERSRAARLRAGTFGPSVESELEPHGLTLRHFPQSFEMSTVGGWIATRASGHYATGRTRIDHVVESLRVVTPKGVLETDRAPSGAGPSAAALLLGSEGTLGIITEAWLRVEGRARSRSSRTVAFPTFDAGVDAVRALAQSTLLPANCRLLDPLESLLSGAGDGTRALLLLGFESSHIDTLIPMSAALDLCRSHGGEPAPARDAREPGGADAWRAFFLRAPHIRDAVVRLGVITETFETATTWDRFPALYAAVVDATRCAIADVCGRGLVTCRVPYAYADGAAAYFTVVARARPDQEIEQWLAIKTAASDALQAAGGTITHHHAVGRTHRPWYDRERPPLFADALRSVKAELDPRGIMNPGVLLG